MKVYISGQITGLQEKEYIKRFNAAEKMLREHGHVPVNPITLNAYDLSYDQYMAIDMILLEGCDAIYMLENWKESKGARMERNRAMELGIDIAYEKQNALDALKDYAAGIRKIYI